MTMTLNTDTVESTTATSAHPSKAGWPAEVEFIVSALDAARGCRRNAVAARA